MAPRNVAIPHGGSSRFAARHVAPHLALPHISVRHTRATAGRFTAYGGGRLHVHAAIHERPAPGGTDAGQRPGSTGQEITHQARPGAAAGQRGAPIIRNAVFAAEGPAGGGAAPRQWTFRGRYIHSAFHTDDRREHRHGGIVLGFVGPLFWPYAYDDFVDYTFDPHAYDTFWPYAFDDIYAGIYGGYALEYHAPLDAYAYAGSPASERAYVRIANLTSAGNATQFAGDTQICAGGTQGVVDFSIHKIVDQVKPDQDQQQLLDELRAASVKAVEILQEVCPSDLPSTPTGRLAVMRARVEAMLKAVETVHPALEKFYQSLSDEQRERFIAVDRKNRNQAGRRLRDVGLNELCQGDLDTRADLPIEKIKRSLRLNSDQYLGLRALDAAAIDSATMLQAKCQPDQSLTPTGRLAAMADRLQAMSKALETTRAALAKFYDSLSDEQKAQFDRFNART
jgi:hypothetical protein